MKYVTMHYSNISLDVLIDKNMTIVDVYPVDSHQSIKAVISFEVLNILKDKLSNGDFYLTYKKWERI
jgi:hypothetical protein